MKYWKILLQQFVVNFFNSNTFTLRYLEEWVMVGCHTLTIKLNILTGKKCITMVQNIENYKTEFDYVNEVIQLVSFH